MASMELFSAVLHEDRGRLPETIMNHARICVFLLLGVVIEAYGPYLEGKTRISSETMIRVKHNAM